MMTTIMKKKKMLMMDKENQRKKVSRLKLFLGKKVDIYFFRFSYLPVYIVILRWSTCSVKRMLKSNYQRALRITSDHLTFI